ncbi:hypothetical protein GcM3_094007 [Golovinomyces cichoracearum]|uniref:Duf1770 domain containing protein n=1 Tax=Golovinomyces cichoracearum TaxID=62708 RepID=A0A420IFM8_9PEZI|nr:hypothetical protein GcM3_094007 [Golovinomyces cichoracearum]
MTSSIPLQIAETIQTASINSNPTPKQDLNPFSSTSPSYQDTNRKPNDRKYSSLDKANTATTKTTTSSAASSVSSIDCDEVNNDRTSFDSIFRRRNRNIGPLPDLRFEQSYLNSIAGAKTAWDVAVITFRDQVVLPLLQGTVWSLLLLAWSHWNYTAEISGSSVGAKVRRWWYRKNNWKLPIRVRDLGGSAELAAAVGDVSARWNGGELWSFAD